MIRLAKDGVALKTETFSLSVFSVSANKTSESTKLRTAFCFVNETTTKKIKMA